MYIPYKIVLDTSVILSINIRIGFDIGHLITLLHVQKVMVICIHNSLSENEVYYELYDLMN